MVWLSYSRYVINRQKVYFDYRLVQKLNNAKPMLARVACTCLLLLISLEHSFTQGFGPNVRPYIRIDTPQFVIQNVDVIDGTGGPILRGQSVLVSGDRIVEIGPASEVSTDAETLIIDGTGKTLIPGFVMMHEHMYYPAITPEFYRVNQLDFSFPKLYLAGGATTIRTAGSVEPYSDLNIKSWIEEGKVLGPKMDVTAPYINHAGLPLPQVNAIENAEDARRMVRYWAAEGATSFKVYEQIHKEELKATVEEAHNLGLKVTGHLCSITFQDAADLGIDNLEHGFMVASDFVEGKESNKCQALDRRNSLFELDVESPRMKRLIDYLVEKNVAITSTLPIFETFAKGRPQASPESLEALTPKLRESYLKTWEAINQGDDTTFAVLLSKEMAWEKAFFDAGGHLMVGTDPTGFGGVMAGYSNIRALEMLVEAGFSVSQAVMISSLNGARYLGIEGQIGTVEEGKIADLVLVDGQLASDITQLRRIEIVFKDGIGYDSPKIFESVKGTVGLH